jgi:multiple sugar transport system substrate-binding protein/sn-glycerol 3-phosphate transport system substrate-binding protein
MLLVVSLAACDSLFPTQETAPADLSETLSPGTPGTPQPSPTDRPSGYVTRTPASTAPALTPTAVETLAVKPEQLAGQEVVFWTLDTGQSASVLRKIIDEYNRSNPWKVQARLVLFDSFTSLEEAFLASLEAGNPPGLLALYDDRAQSSNLSGNTLVDLQPYLADPNWGWSSSEQADFYPEFWQQGMAYASAHSGTVTEQLGIPWLRSLLVLAYNQTWAQELGYSQPPTTPSELRSQVCKAAGTLDSKDQPGQGGLMLSAISGSTPGREMLLSPEQLLGWVAAFGGQVNLPEGAGYQFNTPETRRTLEFLQDLRHDRCLYLNPNTDPAADFSTRQGLLYLAGSAELPVIQDALQAAGSQDEWTVLPFPSPNGAASAVAYGPSLVIPQSNDRRQLAAWTLLKWLVEPDQQARWARALEAYPTRRSALDSLETAAQADPQWGAGLSLLDHTQAEPALPSWVIVRWMMGDALATLFSPDFTADQIPALLENLDQQAAEVNNQVR